MKTLEQLAGWLLFSLSVLMVYGLLSLFLISPTHASYEETHNSDGTLHWMLELTIGTHTAIPHTMGTFITEDLCKYVAKLMVRDLRKTNVRKGKITVECLTSE